MKDNIIQMIATSGLTLPHSINPIFQYIFDCSGFDPMNVNFDFVFQGLNRLWMVSVTLILNGSPQKIVQRGQITVPRRPIDNRISADYSIFENGAQKIDFYVGCVVSSPVLLEPIVVHVILFNFWKQKFVEHGTVTLAIDRNSGSLIIFKEKWPNNANVPKFAPNIFYGEPLRMCYANHLGTIEASKHEIEVAIHGIEAQTIENVLKNCFDRMGYFKASRCSHLNDVVFHS